MMDITLTQRVIENKDWATLLFLLCFGILAINRNVYEVRFAEYLRLIVSEKYTKIYKDSSNIKNSFTISLFFVQLISGTFFVQICLKSFGYINHYSLISFLRILNFITFFILAKYLIEKIVAIAFNIEEFSEQFNLQKVNYRTYVSLLILPANLILFYNDFSSKIPLFIIMLALMITNIILYIIFLRNYQNLILNRLFYFILYLCTLEIAPYFFLYYWFTKS
ncbi:DUF4271 domain-containing protein [Flavobacterium sp. NKUCC04_CG]|uniref:DUF4271 domain-containing protein n=1 Tax=Flavobacterium sp. NKUCC04_CG TaxID=2842121 RepID=UPI001C5AEBA1|nr:DUF4271 domain-containing protein [Flavobacterium sp. NKUCC04_CG]MBW3518923.1 DUF4271 domain-containing protein [Flavobacterium sp. NKUCC04_CG]